jgi:hypothetical protein
MDATSGYIGGLTIQTYGLSGSSTTISDSSVSSSTVTASGTTVNSSGVTSSSSTISLGSASGNVHWGYYQSSSEAVCSLMPTVSADLSGWTDFNSNGGGFYGVQCKVDTLIVDGSEVKPGTKSVNMDTKSYGEHLLYCYEMPTRMFGDIGRAELDETGTCYVYLDDTFLETINTNANYNVFLQKYGQGDIWIEDIQPTYFVVSGTPGLKFAWELKANQIGDNNTRLETPTEYDTTARDDESNIMLVVDKTNESDTSTKDILSYQSAIIQSDTSSSDIEDYLYSLL